MPANLDAGSLSACSHPAPVVRQRTLLDLGAAGSGGAADPPSHTCAGREPSIAMVADDDTPGSALQSWAGLTDHGPIARGASRRSTRAACLIDYSQTCRSRVILHFWKPPPINRRRIVTCMRAIIETMRPVARSRNGSKFTAESRDLGGKSRPVARLTLAQNRELTLNPLEVIGVQ